MTVWPQNIEVREVKYQPIIRAYAQRIGLIEEFNRQLNSSADVEAGDWALLMVLDTLTGRSPLYRLDEFASSLDLGLILGKDYASSSFNDDAAGRFLDQVYEAGSMKLFTSCALRACEYFDLDLSYLRFDTTSRNLAGSYEFENSDLLPFLPTYGYSKDKRPDLKQIIISTLCIDRNVPLLGSFEDGNASDKKLNNSLLSRIAKDLSSISEKLKEAVYVADSALVNKENLQSLGGLSFVTRLPATYAEHSRVIHEAVEGNVWEEIGSLAHTVATKRRPHASYRIYDSEVELYDNKYRAIVVHSSAHDKRRHKKLEREKENSRKKAEAQVKAQAKVDYACRADAEEAAVRINQIVFSYHKLEVNIEEKPCYERGRPAKGKARQVKNWRYKLQICVKEREDIIAQKEEEAGCFVLLSDLSKEGKEQRPAKELLEAYKDQHAMEQNYGFLKDPVIVNSLLLKKPQRLEALGAILLLSLLIWRLFERSMRNYVKEEDTELIGLDKRKTKRPTSYMMTTKFMSVLIVKWEGKRYFAEELTEVQMKYLLALGLSSKIFTQFALALVGD